jgi:hypothetical protein
MDRGVNAGAGAVREFLRLLALSSPPGTSHVRFWRRRHPRPSQLDHVRQLVLQMDWRPLSVGDPGTRFNPETQETARNQLAHQPKFRFGGKKGPWGGIASRFARGSTRLRPNKISRRCVDMTTVTQYQGPSFNFPYHAPFIAKHIVLNHSIWGMSWFQVKSRVSSV